MSHFDEIELTDGSSLELKKGTMTFQPCLYKMPSRRGLFLNMMCGKQLLNNRAND